MTQQRFHLHLVSDSTGETLIAASRAAAAQYQGVASIEHVYPLVRSQKQLDRVLAEIEESPGIVLFTLLRAHLHQSHHRPARRVTPVPSRRLRSRRRRCVLVSHAAAA